MSNPPDLIISPIATSRTRSATLNLPWFVQRTEYPPVQATFEPLVNGERAFGAVYDAILAATKTVEIVCWGFQPSMYFKRDGQGSLCIGDLLMLKAEQGVKVRVLCWYDSLHIAQVSENMMPGDNFKGFSELGDRNTAQQEYDQKWYSLARLTYTGANHGVVELTQRFFNTMRNRRDAPKLVENIEFVTRDFGLLERAEIAWKLAWQAEDQERSVKNKVMTTVVLTGIPTHHQKSVMVDYEAPDKAVGFIMGHNTLDAYWDRDDHRYARMHAQHGRNGQTPRQDISSRVTGQVLEHINHNFCQAWQKETGVDLLTPRKPLAKLLAFDRSSGKNVVVQVLRTQSQEGVRDVKALYLKAVNNVTKFIYIENQYFRWKPLSEKIKEAVQNQLAGGRVPEKHGSVHLFVVTNSSKEGMGDGTVNTQAMLKSLGRENLMPTVSQLQRNDELDDALKKATTELYDAQKSLGSLSYIKAHITDELMEKLRGERMASVAAAQAHHDQLASGLAEQKKQPIESSETRGLKMHICTLVAPDSPPDNWMDVYIHSKLMIVDDVFTTLGSSNINNRSMEVDSELNICLEAPAITQPLRKQLWDIHTGGMGAQDDVAEAFDSWAQIININNKRRKANKQAQHLSEKQSPYASLVEFFNDGALRSNWD